MRFDPRAGARNLLLNCVGAAPGDTVVIVGEDPSLGFYDALAARCIAEVAGELGCRSRQIPCGCVPGPEQLPSEVVAAFGEADHVIFQARAGDQVRFTTLPGSATKTMSYALDIGLLGSAFCTLHHGLMEDLLDTFERELGRSRSWRIRCPLGTEAVGTVSFSSTEVATPASSAAPASPATARAPGAPAASETTGAPVAGEEPAAGTVLNGFSLRLFPVPIFRPVLCTDMTGRVVLSRWLMSTANHLYERDSFMLPEPVTAIVQGGRIKDIEGPANLVRGAREHYRRVAELFGIDANVVHSWHAGIHPQAFYPLNAGRDINRWGSVAFANPRYAHFHTCGDYAPGEIAWSVFDATLEVDGRPLWDRGRFLFLDRPGSRALAEKHGVPLQLLEQRWDIGLRGEQGPKAALW